MVCCVELTSFLPFEDALKLVHEGLNGPIVPKGWDWCALRGARLGLEMRGHKNLGEKIQLPTSFKWLSKWNLYFCRNL